ncbi:phage terminase large subunit family protein [Candidatus Pacearchaeota archaeon]|nr:phage terminase large subunit family protein [Candidatus Pacearchaeota archaeon]
MTEAAKNYYTPFSIQERKSAAPPEYKLPSEWVPEEFSLDATSKVKGFFPLNIMPTKKFILDKCVDPNIRRIWYCKPAQVGGTAIVSGLALYFAMHLGVPVMINLASESTAHYVGGSRIQYAIEKNPRLNKMTKRGSYSDTEMTFINFGYLVIGWSGSVTMTGTRTIAKLFNDEIDKDGYNKISSEAGSLERLTERTSTYDDSLELNTGTPTDENGNMCAGLKNAELIYDFHVPCPHCGQFQPMFFNHDTEYLWGFKDGLYRDFEGKMMPLGMVVWEGGSKATIDQIKKTARYKCGSCEGLWTNAQKNRAIDNYKAVSRTEPKGNESDIGIHEWRIITKLPGGRLFKIVSDYVTAITTKDQKLKKSKLQTFANSTLAQFWAQVVMSKTQKNVLSASCAVPFQTVPQDAVAVNLYIDNQKTGKWYAVQAWDNLFNSWMMEYNYIASFDDLSKFILNTTYPALGSGDRKGFWRIGIDTGGGKLYVNASMTEEVYLWILYMRTQGITVHATKGSSKPILGGYIKTGASLQRTPSNRPIPGGLPIISLDTNQLKDMYHGRLNNAISKDVRGAYLYAGIGKTEIGKTFASQISAEVKKENNKGVRKWVDMSGGNNHALDIMIGHEAMASPFWAGGGVNNLNVQDEKKPENKKSFKKTKARNIREVPAWRKNFTSGR